MSTINNNTAKFSYTVSIVGGKTFTALVNKSSYGTLTDIIFTSRLCIHGTETSNNNKYLR